MITKKHLIWNLKRKLSIIFDILNIYFYFIIFFFLPFHELFSRLHLFLRLHTQGNIFQPSPIQDFVSINFNKMLWHHLRHLELDAFVRGESFSFYQQHEIPLHLFSQVSFFLCLIQPLIFLESIINQCFFLEWLFSLLFLFFSLVFHILQIHCYPLLIILILQTLLSFFFVWVFPLIIKLINNRKTLI